MIRAIAIAAALVAAGCSLSAFDDLAGEAWSDSNGEPSGVDSDDYGVSVTSVATDTPGATIVVAGFDPAAIATVSYDDTGSLSQRGIAITGIGQPDNPPVVAGTQDPVNGGAIVAVGNLAPANVILLFDPQDGDDGPALVREIDGDICGGDLDDFGSAMVFGLTNIGDPDAPDLIGIAGNQLLLFPDVELGRQPTCFHCTLPSDADDVILADIGGEDGDEIVVSTAGQLISDNAQFFVNADDNNCLAPATPQISNLTSNNLEADFGATLATGDVSAEADVIDIAATAPSTGKVYVFGLEVSGPVGLNSSELVEPRDAVEFGTDVAFADVDGIDGDEVIVSDRLASPDGESNAGQAAIYDFSDADGFELVAVIHDSSPETGQNFGRSLAVAEFVSGADDTDLLVAGAQGEVFTYFRALFAGTDPRQ